MTKEQLSQAKGANVPAREDDENRQYKEGV